MRIPISKTTLCFESAKLEEQYQEHLVAESRRHQLFIMPLMCFVSCIFLVLGLVQDQGPETFLARLCISIVLIALFAASRIWPRLNPYIGPIIIPALCIANSLNLPSDFPEAVRLYIVFICIAFLHCVFTDKNWIISSFSYTLSPFLFWRLH